VRASHLASRWLTRLQQLGKGKRRVDQNSSSLLEYFKRPPPPAKMPPQPPLPAAPQVWEVPGIPAPEPEEATAS
jgi:hypothetical protein